MQIRVDSTEYATATVTTDRDVPGASIEVALPVTGTSPAVWHPAELVSSTAVRAGHLFTYRLLIGPDGTVTLPVGVYDWTVRFSGAPERAVRNTDRLRVTRV